jgi:hypothetical protein
VANAQDQALLALATRQGLLPPSRAARLRQLHRELGHRVPLAHLLLNGQLLSSSKVAGLLRELASGSFACVRCAERLPYFSLAGLAEATCPLCAGELHYFPNPRERAGAGGIPLLGAGDPSPEEETAAQCSDRLGRGPLLDLPPGDEAEHEPTLMDGLRETRTRAGALHGSRGGPGRLGEWELLAVLGRGGSGVVYHARHARSGQEAALKLLRGDLSDSGDVARFHLEAQVARRLRHPGIIPVFEVGVADERYFYVMELCRGETLQQRLKRGPLAPREAVRLVAALCEAVGFAHDHGFIHRDLKPANVLLDPREGRPRVTDFGLARDRDQGHGLTRTGELLGTPGYMAPEQFLGERVDERTDLHALGAILYECLTGERPWVAPSVILLAELICHQEAQPPSQRRAGIPAALDAVCLRALAKDPQARFSGAGELRAALLPWGERTRPPPS